MSCNHAPSSNFSWIFPHMSPLQTSCPFRGKKKPAKFNFALSICTWGWGQPLEHGQPTSDHTSKEWSPPGTASYPLPVALQLGQGLLYFLEGKSSYLILCFPLLWKLENEEIKIGKGTCGMGCRRGWWGRSETGAWQWGWKVGVRTGQSGEVTDFPFTIKHEWDHCQMHFALAILNYLRAIIFKHYWVKGLKKPVIWML